MANSARERDGGRGRRWRIARWGGAAVLLLLPLVAMRFTSEVDWTPFDFVVFAALLVAACGAYELVLRVTRDGVARALAGAAVVAAFVLAWAELAVGLFD